MELPGKPACLDHGFVGGAHCPTCGESTYPVGNSDERDFLRECVRRRQSQRFLAGGGIGAVAAVSIAAFVTVVTDFDLMTRYEVQFVFMVVIGALVEVVLYWRLSDAQRQLERAVAPLHARRLLTSVPLAAVVVVVTVFIATTVTVEIQATYPAQYDRVWSPTFEPWVVVPSVLAQGRRLYTLATHAGFHANLEHLISNVFGLLVFGMTLAPRLARRWGLALLTAGLLAGAAAHVALTGLPDAPLMGVSGAVFAFAGAHLVVFADYRLTFLVSDKPRKVPAWPFIMLAAAGIAATQQLAIPELFGPVHAGGLIAGLAIGCARRLTKED